jgi:tRNA 2-thiouridine synthesizing protein A
MTVAKVTIAKVTIAKTLDTTGLKCPLPVLKARRAMKEIEAGAVLEVRATDPGAVEDFAAFCETTGDKLLASRQEGELYIFQIRKGG